MIRDLKQKDIDKVMEIWLESTIKAHDFIPEKYWQDNYNAVKDIYIPQSKTYVYEEGEEIKGFISILNDDFIGALFVSLNEQGKGIGSKLIEYANAKFDNLKFVPFSPKLEFGTVLVWKKNQVKSIVAETFIEFAKEYIKGISDNTI